MIFAMNDMKKWLFSLIWHRFLDGDKVVEIAGWRSAILETEAGQRYHVVFCFWRFQ